MSLYNIPHGLTSNSSCSACPKIPYHWEMQHICGASEYFMTISKVPNTEDTIKFMLDTENFTYNVDIFRDTLHLLVGTLKNPFVAPVIIQTIEAFMNRVGYQGVVDKVSAFYTKNLAQACQTMFKVFNRCLTTRTSEHDQTKINILQLFHVMINRTNVDYAALLWIDEDYNSIKDDIPLVSVYTTRNVLVRGMLILDEFLIEEIHATNDYKEYEMVFMNVVVLMNLPQPVVSTQGMHRTTPRAHRTPTLTTAKKLDEDKIEKMVEGDKDEESYASEFADSMIKDDVDDFGTRIEPGSHKEHPKNVNGDDEEIEKEMKDDEIEKEEENDVSAMSWLNLAVNKDREVDPINAQEMISKEFTTHLPKMIEELFRKHMQNTTLNLYPTTSSSTAGKSTVDL
ncbi:hypothetical protein Tco_0504830 [Tanacetum coccineum]